MTQIDNPLDGCRKHAISVLAITNDRLELAWVNLDDTDTITKHMSLGRCGDGDVGLCPICAKKKNKALTKTDSVSIDIFEDSVSVDVSEPKTESTELEDAVD